MISPINNTSIPWLGLMSPDRTTLGGKTAPSVDSFSPTARSQALSPPTVPSVNSAALQGAMDKLRAFSEALAGADSLDAAMTVLLRDQLRQTDQGVKGAEHSINGKLKDMELQTRKELKLIKERAEARKKAARWGKFLKVFKIVAAAASAVGSVFTGGALGVVAAALLVSGLVVSETVKNDAGKWAGLGLSLAGGVAGLFGASSSLATSVVGKTVAQYGRVGLRAGELAAKASESGCTVGLGVADARVNNTAADVQDLKAIKARLTRQQQQETEEMQTLLDARDKAIDLVLKAMGSNHDGAMSAV